MRSEVADVTGILTYIGKSVFRHQNVGGENVGLFSRLFTVKPLTSFIQLFSLKVLLRSVAISIPRISTALSCKLCFLTNSALANTAAALPSDVGLI